METSAQKVLVINTIAKVVATLVNSLSDFGYNVTCTDDLNEIDKAIGDYDGAIAINLIPHVVTIERNEIKQIVGELNQKSNNSKNQLADLIEQYVKNAELEMSSKEEAFSITHSESKILKLLQQGKTNTQIASELFCSRRTIESHISNMLNKTRFQNRTELAVWASNKY